MLDWTGGRGDEKEGGTGKKEGRGGRRDGRKEGRGELKNKRVVKKMENEKVAKGRIIGLAGPCLKIDQKKTVNNRDSVIKKVERNRRY